MSLILSILEQTLEIGEMNVHDFFESLLSVTYINSVTHGAFYFLDYTSKSAFTFVDIFSVEFRWKKIVTFSIHQVLYISVGEFVVKAQYL